MHGSDDEKDKESDDDYDIDNEFFVPHGHLSDEELGDELDVDDNTPDTQKAKLKIIQNEFAAEMKKKTEKIKPRLIGAIWRERDGSKPSSCPNIIWEMLQSHAMIFTGPSVIIQKATSDGTNRGYESGDEADSKPKRPQITNDLVAELIRLVHGNTNNCVFLVKEFQQYLAKKNELNPDFKSFSNISIRNKIKELAVYGPCPDEGVFQNKYCWYVTSEKQQVYGVVDLQVPNNWTYILKPKQKIREELKDKESTPVSISPVTVGQLPIAEPIKTPQSKSGIAKFTKVLNDVDKKKQFNSLPISTPAIPAIASCLNGKGTVSPGTTTTTKAATTNTAPVVPKKRVNLLMSVPRGQQIPTGAKNALISQFLKNNSTKKTNEIIDINASSTMQPQTDDIEMIELD